MCIRWFTVWFTLALLSINLPHASASKLAKVAQRDFRLPNSSTTASLFLTSTSNNGHPTITPPPRFKIPSSGDLQVGGEHWDCFNSSFVGSLSKWIGNQTVPQNDCWEEYSTSCRKWSSVILDVGSVELFYFPTAPSNKTHPSTLYDPKYDYTFTSPSVYMVWKTIQAWNTCGMTSVNQFLYEDGYTGSVSTSWVPVPVTLQVGPVLKNVIQAFDLNQISSYPPASSKYLGFLDGPQPTQIPNPQPPSNKSLSNDEIRARSSPLAPPQSSYIKNDPVQLTLSDIGSADCIGEMEWIMLYQKSLQASGLWQEAIKTDDRLYRCNPYLVIPGMVRDFGLGWWRDSKIGWERDGMPDPPHALTFDSQLLPTTTPTPEVQTPFLTFISASPVATPMPAAAPTTPSSPGNGNSNVPTKPGDGQEQNTNPQKPSPGNIDHHPSSGSNNDQSENEPTPNNPNPGSNPASNRPPTNDGKPVNKPSLNDNPKNSNGETIANPKNSNPSASVVSVALIGTHVISATLGSVTTLQAKGGKPVIVSVGSAGNVVLSTIGEAQGSTRGAGNDGAFNSLMNNIINEGLSTKVKIESPSVAPTSVANPSSPNPSSSGEGNKKSGNGIEETGNSTVRFTGGCNRFRSGWFLWVGTGLVGSFSFL